MDISLTPREEKELLEMFFFESQERHQSLNELLTSLEGDLENHMIIDNILRVTHTMKGNAMGMNQVGIADLAHVMEEVFEAVNKGEVNLSKELFIMLYKLTDKIGQLINNIKEGKKISHKGIKMRIQVFLKESRKEKGLAEAPTIAPKDTPREIDSNNELSDQEMEEMDEIDQDALENTTLESEKDQKEIESPRKPFLTHFWGQISNKIKRNLGGKNHLPQQNTGAASETQTMKEVVEDINPSPNLQSAPSQSDPVETFDRSLKDRPNFTVDDEKSAFDLLGNEVADGGAEEKLQKDLQSRVTMADMVQVPVRKLDILMNQVGQLIIERDRLLSDAELSRSRKSQLAGLQRVTSDLQYSVMDVRLVQVGSLFSKFHRIARDVARIENKEINLVVKGSEVEIDRNILQIISDSMVHLVRNAVGHGIEEPGQRTSLGKQKVGTITLSARNEKDNVIIEVADDGKGIDAHQIRKKIVHKKLLSQDLVDQLSDEEVIMHIFDAGFSNAEKINEVSGRGVGMDVVKKATESIGGLVKVETKPGEGTKISLKLPSSMVVKGVLMFMVGDQEFAVSLPYTEAVVSLKKSSIRKAGTGLISSYLKNTISILFLKDLLDLEDLREIYERDIFLSSFDECDSHKKFEVIIINHSGRLYGIVVDKLLQQKDIIEKPLPKPLDNNRLLSGTTIMGNGNVCMIIDAVAITDLLYTSKLKIQEHLKAS